jgi:hypothetical protein
MTRRVLLGGMQLAVFLGVYGPMMNAHRGENAGFAIGILSLMATLFATAIVIEIGDRWARLTGRAPPLTPQQRRDARQSPLRPRRPDAGQERR